VQNTTSRHRKQAKRDAGNKVGGSGASVRQLLKKFWGNGKGGGNVYNMELQKTTPVFECFHHDGGRYCACSRARWGGVG